MTITTMQIQAPTRDYTLHFKHLRGYIREQTITNGRDPVTREQQYVCGTYSSRGWQGLELNQDQVLELLTSNPEPLPWYLIKEGHRVATAAYIGTGDGPSYYVGVALAVAHGARKDHMRRVALTDAIANLPTVDRAYFHLCLSMMEGRDVAPIIGTALARRGRPSDRQVFVEHVHKQLVKGYLRKELDGLDELTVQSVKNSWKGVADV